MISIYIIGLSLILALINIFFHPQHGDIVLISLIFLKWQILISIGLHGLILFSNKFNIYSQQIRNFLFRFYQRNYVSDYLLLIMGIFGIYSFYYPSNFKSIIIFAILAYTIDLFFVVFSKKINYFKSNLINSLEIVPNIIIPIILLFLSYTSHLNIFE